MSAYNGKHHISSITRQASNDRLTEQVAITRFIFVLDSGTQIPLINY